VLAVAVRRRLGLPREGFLVSREVAGGIPLPEFLTQCGPLRTDLIEELADELADMTARLFNAGFYHDDYHIGNLVVRPDAPAGSKLYLVDLHEVRRARVTRRRALRMLAMLSSVRCAPGVEHAHVERFLRRLLCRWQNGPGCSEASIVRWAHDVKRIASRRWRRRARSRTRRCMVESTLFTRDVAEGFVVRRRRDFPLDAVLEAVRTHRAAIADAEATAQVRRKGRRTQVTLCPCDAVPPVESGRPASPDALAPGTVCVKAFLRVSLLERLKDAVRPKGRARAAWIAAHGFAVRRIPAPRPLAIESDGNLGELAFRGLPTGRMRRRLGRAVAAALNRLAEAETYHPDTKPTNFLIRAEPAGGFRAYLVDLDRAKFDTPLRRRHWVKCLARLNAGLPASVSLLDRMRVLRECSRGRWEGAERKEIACQVYRLSLARRPAWLQNWRAGGA